MPSKLSNRKSHPRRLRTPLSRALYICAVLLLMLPRPAAPYSFETHEQLIDLAWKNSIRPVLLKRYPHLSEQQLLEAHAYAYGGSAIQDLGYYPFGHTFFSNLTHYVRSGDFVLNLIRDSRNANELAFGIGALSHYVGDTIGHPDSVNLSVPVEFPGLIPRYGPIITYEEDKHAHVRTEFAFDVNEVAKHHFTPSGYLKFVGLEVPDALLRQAFFQTYGLEMAHSLGYKRPVVPGYRFAIRRLLPLVTHAEVLLHKDDLPPDTPSESLNQLNAALNQADVENGWSNFRENAGIRVHLLAALIYILPKWGALSDLAIRGPRSDTRQLYVESVNRSTASLRHLLQNFDGITNSVPNLDLDTGSRTQPGAYSLTDRTYADLVHRLTHGSHRNLPPGLKQNIAIYYADPAETTTAKDPSRMAELEADLRVLQAMPESAEAPAGLGINKVAQDQ